MPVGKIKEIFISPEQLECDSILLFIAFKIPHLFPDIMAIYKYESHFMNKITLDFMETKCCK